MSGGEGGGVRGRFAAAYRVGVVAVTAVVAAACVLAGVRLMAGSLAAARNADPKPPPLDARAVAATVDTGGGELPGVAAVPGSARLVMVGPRPVVDTRRSARPRAGAEVAAVMRGMPAGSSAVLLQVSIVDAARAGGVLVTTSATQVRVLAVPKAGAQTTATVVVPIGADGSLRVRTEGGGHLVVYLIGAFTPAETAAAGRVVAVPATRVLRLIPKEAGKNATIRVARVPVLRGGAPAALLLQIAADVGTHGGFVVTGQPGGRNNQELFWSATSGPDRTRSGMLVAPVIDGVVHLHYQAGSALTATLVGYVTGEGAPRSSNGLVVPLGAAATRTVPVRKGQAADIPLVPGSGLAGVPPERIGGVLVGVSVTGEGTGAVTVHAPGAQVFADPLVTASKGATRSSLAVTGTVDGTVQVAGTVGASVRLTPEALLLNG